MTASAHRPKTSNPAYNEASFRHEIGCRSEANEILRPSSYALLECRLQGFQTPLANRGEKRQGQWSRPNAPTGRDLGRLARRTNGSNAGGLEGSDHQIERWPPRVRAATRTPPSPSWVESWLSIRTTHIRWWFLPKQGCVCSRGRELRPTYGCHSLSIYEVSTGHCEVQTERSLVTSSSVMWRWTTNRTRCAPVSKTSIP